jgi:hypothetical protein
MKFRGILIAVLLVASAVPASAMNWSLGANLGYNMIMPANKDIDGDGFDDIESTSQFAWPNSGLVPGLRVGFVGENPTHEFFIDTGLDMQSTKNIEGIPDLESVRLLSLTGNYQYNFGASGSLTPYITAGGGLLSFGQKGTDLALADYDLSAMAAIYGGGVGIRHKMGNGHGTMRAEVRFDRSTEGTDGDTILLSESNVFAVKLGFDLWDK